MSLSPQFLDDLRARTTLSALIGRTVKLAKAGREYKARCPFHSEKSASFTVNDEKGFYHCFGCSAHGDAIRWLIDHEGMAFMDAVRALAADAGIEVPARSEGEAKRESEAAAQHEILEAAATWYGEALASDKRAMAAYADRGIGAETIARFGLGYAPPKRSVASCGIAPETLTAAGLMIEDARAGLWRDRFRQRLMFPIHDHRGRLAGFAGRILGDGEVSSNLQGVAKYINSPESPHFAKGELLYNLHRASPAARQARRLIVVEGQFDVIALDRIGIGEAVAPQGTALTERQLERAWRVSEAPILLFDGDEAGAKAALRACERAMPHAAPGRSLRVAVLPAGEDPDSLARTGGREAIEAAIAAAEPMDAWIWQTLLAGARETPEARAGLWKRLATLAAAIRDAETRAQYLAGWRSRFDNVFPPPPLGLTEEEMLPDGRVADLSQLGEEVRARLRSVSAAWLVRTIESAGATRAKAGRWAWELGRRVSDALVDEGEAQELLDELAAALAKSDSEAEAGDLARSFEFGRRRGFDAGPLLTDMKCAQLRRTDKANAERWFIRFGEDYLYTTAKGWLGWDARRYRVLNQEKDTTPAEVLASVFTMVEALQREADFIRDTGWPEDEEIAPDLLSKLEEDPRRKGGMDRMIPGGRKPERLSAKLAAWSVASEASGRIGCIANLAKRWVTVELTEFDTEPMLLNCLNGTLRFIRADAKGPARVELRPHDRADRLTKLTACAYDADAAAPLFQKLIKWAQPDRARRRYLRQWLGYNLTGDMGEQIFHIWYGPKAANGKSTVGNACREAIGDYGDVGKAETFLDTGINKRGDAATPDIVRLPGVRMLTAGEPKPGMPIDEPLINGVTGGDALLARDNFRSFFRFAPIFKFTLWCNLLPPIPRGTAGIWRRVKVVPWEEHLEEHERDRDLPIKLRAEYEGILAWVARGLIDWMENGFIEPDSVQLAVDDYKRDSDPISSFLRTCTVMDPAARVQSSQLHELFTAWARAAGEKEWSNKGFTQALKAKGLVTKASNGIHWLGIKATRSASDFVDHEGKVHEKLLGLDDQADAADPASARPQPRAPPDAEPLPDWDGDKP